MEGPQAQAQPTTVTTNVNVQLATKELEDHLRAQDVKLLSLANGQNTMQASINEILVLAHTIAGTLSGGVSAADVQALTQKLSASSMSLQAAISAVKPPPKVQP